MELQCAARVQRCSGATADEHKRLVFRGSRVPDTRALARVYTRAHTRPHAHCHSCGKKSGTHRTKSKLAALIHLKKGGVPEMVGAQRCLSLALALSPAEEELTDPSISHWGPVGVRSP